MTELLTLLIFNSLYIFGFYYAVDYSEDVDKNYAEGEILGRLGYYARNLPEWLKKPILGCVVCMASIHSYPFWLVNEVTLLNAGLYILYTFALSGLNALVNETITS